MERTRPATPVIFAITASGIMANPMVAPVIPDILADLDAPAAAAGWVIGAVTMPGILMAPLIGVMADRFGRRTVLVPCLTLFGLAGAMAMTAQSIEALAMWRLLQGVGSAGLVNLAVVLIGDHWGGQARATMIGRNSAVLTISLTVLPLFGGALGDIGGWRLAFAPFTIAFVTAAAVWRRLPAGDGDRETRMVAHFAGALPKLRSRQGVIVLSGGFLLFALIFGVLLTVMPVYLESGFGLSATARGLVLGSPALANTAMALSMGRLRASWSPRTLLMAGACLLVVALLGASAAGTVPLLVASIVLFGAGQGLLMPTMQERAATIGGAEARATVMATFVGVSRLGQTVGPIAIAWVAAGLGGVPAAFTASAAVAGAMALLFSGMPGPEADEADEAGEAAA